MMKLISSIIKFCKFFQTNNLETVFKLIFGNFLSFIFSHSFAEYFLKISKRSVD